MITTMSNPWLNLDRLSRIRVKGTLKYNVFWIVDVLNQYGLMVQFDKNFIPKREIKLNGIQVQLDNSSTPNKLILILKEMKDWEIFLILCNDLIDVMKEHEDDIVSSVMKRLERWQKLLQKTTNRSMSKEEQMGLFSELKVLQNYIIPNYGYANGVFSWVGGLGDKQDFLLENLAIEVKSHRVTSGNTVWISSKEQLNSEKKPLYLLACALSEISTGETVDTLVKSIASKVDTESIRDEFLEKVEQYGYIAEIHNDSLTRFNVEQVNSYEVNDKFPKISLSHVSPVINNLKYSLDLSGCSNFKMETNDIF
ncbi:hypothetical protein N782_02380 [Pontibacillus yanchengensis Y32]|uniref:PD-(D/E)XK motif protein n=2 Tax=Pontibacillus yanchengensis TaxID=462910 RepID=A0A0A2TI28_9BACI|nr:hypothetical protein N782_02380 [Pontibacillus yanchengensis Y32]